MNIVYAFLAVQLSSSFQIDANGLILSYEEARKALLLAEDELASGGHTHLNSKEIKVDNLLMEHKYGELTQAFHNAEKNTAALHFFKAKNLIDRSHIYNFLRRMPKGALLHLHTTASVSSSWFVRHISYMRGLLRCTNRDGVSLLTFRQLPQEHNCQSQYVKVSDERARATNPEVFDRYFEKLINLYSSLPEFEYATITTVWTKFQNIFYTMHDALRYLQAFRAYIWQMLEEMYEDNIMYAEVRMDFKELYDSSGRLFPTNRTIQEFLSILDKFKRLHPRFLDVKVIYSTQRNSDKMLLMERFKVFKDLHAAYPKFIIGFDLVGQEDKGKPLHDLIELLNGLPRTAGFFFHAGETNWYGASTDFNLLDALLLNTTRIGHGYALTKHPVLMNAVKARNIAVEVSPISNQVLHLVRDLRNHPASVLLAQDVPMVICNDDPGMWNAKGLSYDYYYTLMSIAPNNAGLRVLKTLVWRSVQYSIMHNHERKRAYNLLEQSWDKFIDDVLLGKVF